MEAFTPPLKREREREIFSFSLTKKIIGLFQKAPPQNPNLGCKGKQMNFPQIMKILVRWVLLKKALICYALFFTNF